MQKRIFVMRHLSRDKSNQNDPQTPTLMGMIEAFVMGLILAREFGVKMFNRVLSSPQPRGMRTARLILRAIQPLDEDTNMPKIETDEGLNDFSSDPRFAPLKKLLKAAKMPAALESEQAIFVAGGELEALRHVKVMEALSVIVNETSDESGDILVGGIHGATIDGLYAYFYAIADTRSPEESNLGMSTFGRMIGKCEGFVLTFEDNHFVSVTKIERPLWLNAIAALLGGGSD